MLETVLGHCGIADNLDWRHAILEIGDGAAHNLAWRRRATGFRTVDREYEGDTPAKSAKERASRETAYVAIGYPHKDDTLAPRDRRVDRN